MRKYFQRPKLRKYKNLIEAAQLTSEIKKLFGLGVFAVTSSPGFKLFSKFTPLGFSFFVFWLFLYYYCSFKSFSDDQTILRNLYFTKLKHYGDVFQRVVSILYVTYTSWKIPFHINLRPDYMRQTLVIDDKIERLGVTIDYSKMAKYLLYHSIVQVVAACSRILSVWMTLSHLDMAMPMELLLQVTWSDVLALVTTAHYCHYLIFMKARYRTINDMLSEIRDRKSWEGTVLVRSKTSVNMQKALQLQDKYVCEKIKACAGIYSLLLKASEAINEVFGFALVCTLLFCLFYIVLYLFYFMEATASGLFHDSQKYVYFLVYVFWQIAYSFGVIYLNVYFSEAVVEEAARTSYVLHEVINADISSTITAQAMQFSLQVLHQRPIFTACDLCKIDYELVFEGARSITTYLVILLQFVME